MNQRTKSWDGIELRITSNTRCVPIVRAAVERLAELEGFSPRDSHALLLAIDEALANVIKHGYNGASDQPIVISLRPLRPAQDRSGIEVVVRDQAPHVDPASIKGRPLDEVRPGGLGVHIIQSMMDEHEYTCLPEGGMQLRMIKYATRSDSNEGCGTKTAGGSAPHGAAAGD